MDELQAQMILEEATRSRVLSSWDHQTELEVVSYGERSLGYHWIHYASAMYYNKLNSFLSISVIISSGTTTAVTAVGLNSDESQGLMIILAIFSGISTILASILRFMRAGEQYEKHLNSAIQFQNMANEIKMELSFKQDDRSHAKEFMEKIYLEYNKITADMPTPPSVIVEKFKREIVEKDIAIPEIANGYFRTFKHLQATYI